MTPHRWIPATKTWRLNNYRLILSAWYSRSVYVLNWCLMIGNVHNRRHHSRGRIRKTWSDRWRWYMGWLPHLEVTFGLKSIALLGARLHRPPPSSRRLCMIVHTGHDFPENIREDLFRLDTNTVLKPTPHRLTTRGLNVYKNGQDRGKDRARTLSLPQASLSWQRSRGLKSSI